MITICPVNFPKFLENKFVEWQHREGERKTIADFANYLGVSQAVISFWMNGSRKPNPTSIELLVKTFGLEVYDALGLPRPNEDLYIIEKIFDHLPPTLQRSLREQAETYVTKNLKKKISET